MANLRDLFVPVMREGGQVSLWAEGVTAELEEAKAWSEMVNQILAVQVSSLEGLTESVKLLHDRVTALEADRAR